MSDLKEKKAVIFMADGFEEIEAVTVADILRRAEIPVELVSIMGRLEVTGAHGIKLICDSEFSNSSGLTEDATILILPGGGEGTENLKRHEGLKKELKRFNEGGKLLAAICAAPTVFGVCGILDGKTAVCYPGCENELPGAQIGTENVLISGNVVTSKAAGTAADFALKIAELLINNSGLDGQKVAEKIKDQMYY